MSAGLAKFTIPIVAVIAFAAMLGWLGMRRLYPEVPARSVAMQTPDQASGTNGPAPKGAAPSAPADGATKTARGGAPAVNAAAASGGEAAKSSAAGDSGAVPPAGKGAAAADNSTNGAKQAEAADKHAEARPSFDVVRVEPSGESVIAGRAAPGATVDLMRNGEPMARVMADTSGLFAIVPPPLAPGSQEISLRTIAPDGSRARSNQSVTIVIADNRDRKPLVTVTAPDQPTVVLSRPDEPKVATNAPSPSDSAASTSGAGAAAPSPARAAVRIASVETQGAGRLFVSGTSAPGATVRLYLNDAFVAPGATGPDGKLAFSIERGIRPGAYHVRLDDVDPVSGAVKSRAEVPFSVPEAVVASAAPGAVPPALDGNASAHARAGSSRANSDPSGVATAEPRDGAQASHSSPAIGATSMPRTAAAPGATASDTEILPETGFASLQTDPGQVVVPEVNTAIVSRGDSLWQISKRIYGRGIRYTVIFDANTPQIRNPDLIYPGQIFVLPVAKIQRALR